MWARHQKSVYSWSGKSDRRYTTWQGCMLNIFWFQTLPYRENKDLSKSSARHLANGASQKQEAHLVELLLEFCVASKSSTGHFLCRATWLTHWATQSFSTWRDLSEQVGERCFLGCAFSMQLFRNELNSDHWDGTFLINLATQTLKSVCDNSTPSSQNIRKMCRSR